MMNVITSIQIPILIVILKFHIIIYAIYLLIKFIFLCLQQLKICVILYQNLFLILIIHAMHVSSIDRRYRSIAYRRTMIICL